jgi:hypothetical protein
MEPGVTATAGGSEEDLLGRRAEPADWLEAKEKSFSLFQTTPPITPKTARTIATIGTANLKVEARGLGEGGGTVDDCGNLQ